MNNRIQNIAPLLAYYLIDFEPNSETRKEYLQLVTDNSLRLGPFHKYLGLLHDSWFIDTQLIENSFSTKLNDFTTHVFADALIGKKNININHDKLVFPVHIDFEFTDLSFNTVNDSGLIKELKQTEIHEYLYEQIISVDNDKIDLGLVVWCKGKKGPGKYILILMTVKNINTNEFQDNAWENIFGDKYDDYYKYFKSQLETGRYLSDQSLCEQLIDEFDNKNRKGK
jgi:hypothetical protein